MIKALKLLNESEEIRARGWGVYNQRCAAHTLQLITAKAVLAEKEYKKAVKKAKDNLLLGKDPGDDDGGDDDDCDEDDDDEEEDEWDIGGAAVDETPAERSLFCNVNSSTSDYDDSNIQQIAAAAATTPLDVVWYFRPLTKCEKLVTKIMKSTLNRANFHETQRQYKTVTESLVRSVKTRFNSVI